MSSITDRIRSLQNKEEYSDEDTLFFVKYMKKKLRVPSDYKFILEPLLPVKNEHRLAMIDCVIVSVYGVFCFDIRGRSGVIVGHDNNIFQYLGGKRYSIRPSPVSQSSYHVRVLQEILGDKLNVPIVSLIVFTQADKISYDGNAIVGDVRFARSVIERFNRKVYSYQEAAGIVQALRDRNLDSPIAKIQHLQKLQGTYGYYS